MVDEILEHFNKCADAVERGSLPGGQSGYGRAWAEAGKCHAAMIRSAIKEVERSREKIP